MMGHPVCIGSRRLWISGSYIWLRSFKTLFERLTALSGRVTLISFLRDFSADIDCGP